jgi:4-hydroxybenzoate polyprenyltransferase
VAAEGRELEVIVLFARMLRYRVASMIWLFLLLGAAHPGGLDAVSLPLALATLALASSYVAATSVNDVADEAIDRVNHPRDSGRPLVSGDAEPRDLRRLAVLAWGVALLAAAPLGARALALVGLSLAIGVAYSARPLALSYRTWLAPLVLSVAYVAIPYALGAEAAGRVWTSSDVAVLASLLCLFLARIVLKDFRDRVGDAAYGRPTLLLRFGKRATCAASLAFLVVGAALLPVALAEPWLGPFAAAGAAGIAWMLFRLLRADPGRDEQVAIGLGARLGNGLLVGVLAWLVLAGDGAPVAHRLLALGAVALAFGGGFLVLARRPQAVVLGYKG